MSLPLHVHQRESHDCGVACLAMAANIPYEHARSIFNMLGFDKKQKGREPYSSNFSNISSALKRLGCSTIMKRFRSWDTIDGPTIIKVESGHPRNWHWVYATRSTQWGLVIMDPNAREPYLQHPPRDAMTIDLGHFHPYGNMLVLAAYNPVFMATPSLLPPNNSTHIGNLCVPSNNDNFCLSALALPQTKIHERAQMH